MKPKIVLDSSTEYGTVASHQAILLCDRKELKMTTTKSKYWAVTKNGKPLYEGTFNDCWDWFIRNCGQATLGFLAKDGYKISRIK